MVGVHPLSDKNTLFDVKSPKHQYHQLCGLHTAAPLAINKPEPYTRDPYISQCSPQKTLIISSVWGKHREWWNKAFLEQQSPTKLPYPRCWRMVDLWWGETDPDVTAALPFFQLTKESSAQSSMIVGRKIVQDIHKKSSEVPFFSNTFQKPQAFSKLSLTPEGFAPASWSSYFKLKKGLMTRPSENFSTQTLSIDLFLHLRGSCSIHPRWVQMGSETFHWRLSWIGLDCGQRC